MSINFPSAFAYSNYGTQQSSFPPPPPPPPGSGGNGSGIAEKAKNGQISESQVLQLMQQYGIQPSGDKAADMQKLVSAMSGNSESSQATNSTQQPPPPPPPPPGMEGQQGFQQSGLDNFMQIMQQMFELITQGGTGGPQKEGDPNPLNNNLFSLIA